MPFSVELVGPGRVGCTEQAPEPMQPGTARVATCYSGISAGTEMATYLGTNPYLTKHWDAGPRMSSPGEPAIHYPVGNWGYSEAGQVVAVQVDPLVSHMLPAPEAQHAFEVIESGGPDVLQVVLAFDPPPTSRDRHAQGRYR